MHNLKSTSPRVWSDSDNEINHHGNETVVIVRKTIKYVDDTVVHFTTIV